MENNVTPKNDSTPETTENNAAQHAAAAKKLPAWLILGIIALIAALVLAVTNMVTKGPIAERANTALQAAFAAVMPDAASFEAMDVAESGADQLASAKDAGSNVIGYCVSATGKGYSGNVSVILGVDTQGKVLSAVIGSNTDFSETAGLGQRAKDESFQAQFAGMDAVNGGAFEQLSGATITSNAVKDAANIALAAVANLALGQAPAADPLVVFGTPAGGSEAAQEPAAPSVSADGSMTASAKGFASDVNVTATLDASGAITALTIDASGETEGFGQRAMTDEAFQSQFIGKTLPLALGTDVDALSGATVTSTAVVDALNSMAAAPASSSADGMTGKAKGFQSDVTVTYTTDDAGAIASLTIDASGETEGFGQRTMTDEAFQSQFVGKTAPLTLGEGVDALSGATVTSTAVVEAINSAAPAASSADAGEVVAENDHASVAVTDTTATVNVKDNFSGTITVALTTEDGKITATELESKGKSNAKLSKDGTLATSNAKGFQSNVGVSLALNDDDTIALLEVRTGSETEGIGASVMSNPNFAPQFVGKKGPFTFGEGVDAVSGATVTSNAALTAINDAYDFAVANGVRAAVPEAIAEPVEEPATATEVPAAAGNVQTASAKGFGGDVTVTVTLDDKGVITAFAVDTPSETEGFGKKCSDEAFTSLFIGKTLPVTDVDAVTGATITSTAVMDALNALSAATATPTDLVTASAEKTASAKGFGGDVTVTVTLDDAGVITAFAVDTPNETEGFGKKCSDEAFTSQFIGKTLPVTDVDAVTGATITSTAVLDALNSLAK